MSASDSHATPYSADCKQLPVCKDKKKKRRKRMRCKDAVQHNDFSTQSSLELPVHNTNVVDDDVTMSRDTTTNASEGDQVLLVNELEDVSSDEIKDVEHVYKEHKSGKSKHKHQRVSTDLETEFAVVLSEASPKGSTDLQAESTFVLSEASPKVSTDLETESAVIMSEASPNVSCDIINRSPTKKSTSELRLNTNDILELLHAENSLGYLHSRADVEEAGNKLEITAYCCSIV